jgi:NAD(P)H dehydrogenase (quinone)
MTKPTLLVTGASGHLGRLVVEYLVQGGANVIAASRRPPTVTGASTRKADFDDPKSLDAAFQGVDRLLIISTDAIGRRSAQHRNAIEAAKKARVKHIVYTSLVNPENSPAVFAPEHVVTEKMLKDSGIPHTILRNNIYTDMLMTKLGHVVESGYLAGLAGNGGIGYVTRDDAARAAAAALTSVVTASATYDITGPAIVTQTELADIVSRIAGKPVSYVAITPEAQRKALSPEIAELVVSLEFAMSQGKLAVASADFKKLTQREPQSVASFLEAHRAEFVSAPRKAAP